MNSLDPSLLCCCWLPLPMRPPIRYIFLQGLEEFTTIEGIKFQGFPRGKQSPINPEVMETDQRFHR